MKWGACLTGLRKENFTLLSNLISKKNQFSWSRFEKKAERDLKNNKNLINNNKSKVN